MYSPKHSYKNPDPNTLNIKVEKKDDNFPRFLAMTFMKEINFDEIFREFVDHKLPEFITPSTSAGDSSKSKQAYIKQKINKCGHTGKPHYAKNMCRSCYLKKGRFKKPECEHKDMPMYAKGLCLKCYRNCYRSKKSYEKFQDVSPQHIIEEFLEANENNN